MAGWLELLRGVVHPWHLDHFGHMNVRHYAPFFDDAAYHMWARIGVPYGRMQADHGVHCVTASATTTFLRELMAGDLISVEGVVTRVGQRSAAFRLRMRHAESGEVHATYDLVEVVFDPGARRAATMPDAVRAALLAHLCKAAAE